MVESSAATVQVSGLSATTTQQSLEEYFSFCGSIDSATLEKDGTAQKATVRFLKPSAASNAAMLNGGQLDGATISVTLPGASEAPSGSAAVAVAAPSASSSSGVPHVAQEDKPRSAIVAEVLAHGYKLSDDITRRAIELDNKHGLSTQFKSYLEHIDRSLGEKVAARQQQGATTTATQAPPADAQAQAALDEKDAQKLPPPGASASAEGPTTTTTVPATSASASTQPASFVGQVQAQASKLLNDPTSIVGQAQSRANELLARPDVKSKTDFVWGKFGEYYTKAANHPSIKGFYENASKSVKDVHEEALRIKQQKLGGAAPAMPTQAEHESRPAGVPPSSSIAKSSSSWLLVALLLFSAVGAHAHGGAGEYEHPAEIAGVQPHKAGEESYIQKHMASEHHIGAFDLGSFFSLHDLNRDGVLERSEIEAIYGVHHSTSVKHSPSAEVHDEKAEKIVAEVLRRMDANHDGVVSKHEFINAGPDGLPSFEQYGHGVLGHHYDEESEYFVHHEEVYHHTPETQKDESYTHKEDLEHFAHHEAIEKEEERRERLAEGMPSREEDERRRKEAQAHGKHYESPWDAAQHELNPGHDGMFHEAQRGEYYGGYAQDEAAGQSHHVFRGPGGQHVVDAGPNVLGQHAQQEERLPGETEEGYANRKHLWEQRNAAESYFKSLRHEQEAHAGAAAPQGSGPAAPVKLAQQPGESDEAYRSRLNRAKYEAAQGAKHPSRPLDPAMKKIAPVKYPPIGQKSRLKKSSYFGEF